MTNPKGSVEKLSPKESPKDAHTVLRGAPQDSLKATVTKPKDSVEKLSPKESPEDAHTVLRGAAPKDSVSIRGTS